MARDIIYKTLIDLDYNGNTDGVALQHQFKEWCNNELSKSLEATLKQIDTGNTVKRIDKIELDIDTGNREDWLSQLLKELTLQLQSKLKAILPDADSRIQEQTSERHFFETFFYFLQNGYLPWWSPIINKSEFSVSVSIWLKEGLKGEIREHLLKLLPLQTVRQRLIGQLTEQEFIRLAVELYPDEITEIGLLYEDADKMLAFLPAAERKSASITIRHIILSYAGNVNQQQALQKIAEELTLAFLSQTDIAYVHSTSSKIASKNLKEALQRFKAESEKPTPKDLTEIVNKYVNTKKDVGTNDLKIHLDVEGIYINNTGLIILAPFLSTLFRRINILDEFIILNKDLAVCLAQYLVTGNKEMTEFELVLPKILCGVDPEEMINTDIEITEENIREADELLQSVIEYWSILQNTSIEGLRDSFLQRNGKLSFNNNKWLLQAEQKSFDMLLNQLPWNIHMIQLPWMQNMVETEWA